MQEENTPATYTEEDIQGLKAKNGQVIGENKQLKQQLTDMQTQLGELLEREKTRNNEVQQAELDALEKNGKAEEAFNKRFELFKAEKDAAIADRDSKLQTMAQSIVKGELAQQAAKAGVLPEAVDDVIQIYASQFAVSEQGAVVAANGAMGKDGISPLSPAEVFSSLREVKPYLFPTAKGVGATGNSGSGQIKQFKDMTTQERTDLYQSDPSEFKRLSSQQGQ